MNLTRRSFIAGLIAAPAIVRATSIMPVRVIRPARHRFQYGDLVQVTKAAFRGGPFLGAEIVLRDDGDEVVTMANSWPSGERKSPRDMLELFEGLPGNRGNNPSMKHRLIRQPGGVGLFYPEDLSLRAVA